MQEPLICDPHHGVDLYTRQSRDQVVCLCPECEQQRSDAKAETVVVETPARITSLNWPRKIEGIA